MNLKTRQKHAHKFFDECLSILDKKGKDYSQTEDASSLIKQI